MPDDLTILREPPFDKALADLEDLMTQSGRAFLIGAGCSKCAGLPLIAELTTKTLASPTLSAITREILSALKKQFDGSSEANIEDVLSELVDLLAIAERRTSRGASKNKVEVDGKSYDVQQLKDASEQIKKAIAETIDQPVTIATHWNFIRAVHRPIRPGKPTSDRPVDYLVLNYDTLIEDALALEKLPFTDGLRGGTTAWWDVQSFRCNGLAARVMKLHGSINWSEFGEDTLPRRISTKLQLPAGSERKVLIWPASTKYRETQRDPYAQLAGITREVLRPQSGAQTVLVICGYRFGDSHINLELDRGLRESDGQLTIVVFTSDVKPEGQVNTWMDDPTVRDQVRVYAKKGFFHGTAAATSSNELPWWKFENLVRLLGGER